MIKQFTVRNYKNFKGSITIDFSKVGGYHFNAECVNNNLISKLLIYGQNATGKTNLGNALMDIKRTIAMNDSYLDYNFLNADTEEKYVEFNYLFRFGNEEINYIYSKDENMRICFEKLLFNNELIFTCDFENNKYDFENLYKINAETANVERYKQSFLTNNEIKFISLIKRMSFLKWLINNTIFERNSILDKLFNYVMKMRMETTENDRFERKILNSQKLFRALYENKQLKNLEKFLNVMGVECKLGLKKLPDDNFELYFKHKRLVPFFEGASSGTLAAFDLYMRYIYGDAPSLLFLDEFDAFYHHEMSRNLVEYLKKYFPDTQIILTSHNTNLMTNRLMRPDCLFILSTDGRVTALCDATDRELREAHNLEKMYISGEFEEYE